mmetsp:Transcript_42466/g.76082  ORF Transcript_42466/g.76082 Transcript_42466/m.76082 type:complete len:228 (+) Transcript_42466:2-685(+)
MNLPGNIEAEALEGVFATYGKIKKVYLGRSMSGSSDDFRACAFVKFLLGCEAAVAVQALHGRYEMQPGLGPIAVKSSVPGVFVNLPREVEQDIVDYVFSFYGRVQTVHIMSRNSRNGRAYAFVEYSSEAEVEMALVALHEKQDVWTEGMGSRPADAADECADTEGSSPPGADQRLCVVCLDATQTHAFVPCGHRCVCAECANKVFNQVSATCPICRTAVDQLLRIFF